MNMIFTDNSSQDPYFSLKHMISIFGHPNEMILYLIFGMASSAIFHASIIIQLLAKCYPPKRRGFKFFTETIKRASFFIADANCEVNEHLSIAQGQRT